MPFHQLTSSSLLAECTHYPTENAEVGVFIHNDGAHFALPQLPPSTNTEGHRVSVQLKLVAFYHSLRHIPHS